MAQKIALFVMTVALSSFGLACQLTPTFTTGYQFERSPLREPPGPGKLAVATFEEGRPARYYSLAGRIFLTYVPLVPYVTMPFERLDESIQIQSDDLVNIGYTMPTITDQSPAPPFAEYYYPNSFPKAIAEDLASTGLFDAVDFVGKANSEGYRYVLSGVLNGSEFRTTVTSYGLGMAGVLLWFLPIPMQKTTGSIDVELTLTDQETGKVIWQKHVEESLHRYVMLYTGSSMVYGSGAAWSLNVLPPPSDSRVDRRSLFSWHFETLRRAMLKVKKEIAQVLSHQP